MRCLKETPDRQLGCVLATPVMGIELLRCRPPGGRDLVMSAPGSASQNTSGHRCRRRPRSKNQKSTCGDFGAPYCSCFFSYSYSKRPSIAIRPIGPQVPANRFDQRSELPQFKQPSSTSTVSLSTVRRGGLSTSTTKSDARHERIHVSPGFGVGALRIKSGDSDP
jgi:hypothetical protein